MTLLLTYLFLALGVSFLCSLLEAALLSLPPTYVATLKEKGSRSGRWLAWMKANIDRPLAAILTLNTVAHTFGAAGVGAEAAYLLGHAWIGVVSVVVTILILFVSEIIPKTLGAVHAKSLGPFTAYAIMIMIYGTYPLVVVCEWLSRLVSGGRKTDVVSRDEVLAMARMGSDTGVLSDEESRAIRNLLNLQDVLVRDVMTPRSVVKAFAESTRVSEAVKEDLRFSRLPLFQQDMDHLTGVVHRYRIFEAYAQGRHETPLAELATPIDAIPEVISVADALPQFIQKQQHLFQVVDEYGGTAGILTMEDALETLLGVEIIDETDTVADMRELARRLVRLKRQRAARARRDRKV